MVEPATIVSISVTPASPALASLGATQQFVATARDAAGDVVGQATITWTSSAVGVITIDGSTGLATAVGNGTATITASVGSVSGTATIAVTQTVAAVNVTGTSTLTSLAETSQLNVAATDGGGNTVAGVAATWASSDVAIAAVDVNGLITAIANGTTTITATVNGIDGTIVITVAQTASSISITQQPSTVASSGMVLPQQPVVQLLDANGNNAAVAGTTVMVSIVTGGGTLGGTTSVDTDTNGTATFTNLSITGMSGTRTLSFAAGALSSPASNGIQIGAGNTDPGNSSAAVGPNTTAGTAATITVQARDALNQIITTGGEIVAVSVTGANTAAPTVTDNGNGTYTASYTPTVAGTDDIAVTINGAPVGNSPTFTIVIPAAVDAAASTAIVPTGIAGTATPITVQARDAFGNTQSTGGATTVVSVTGANTALPAVTDNGDGTYSATYTPTTSGPDNIAVTLNGAAIAGSPLTSNVAPGAVSAAQSTANVPGGALAGGTSAISVTARDANGNALTSGGHTVVISVTGANPMTPSVTDNGNGTYSSNYSPTAAGTDNVVITLNGTAISGSPFTTLIGTGAADPTQTTAAVPAGTAGQVTNISVQTKDAVGNNLSVGGEAVVINVTGANTATPTVTDNGDGTYSTSYTPTISGTDNVAILLNGTAIASSPLSSTVAAAALDPAQSAAAVPAGVAGAVTNIVVTARDALGNQVATGGAATVVTITGANTTTPTVTDNGNGTYSTSYTPTVVGTDNVAVTLNGTAIGGSPYSSVVAAGPGDPTQSTATVPANGTAGTATAITVTVLDANGNTTTGGDAVVITVTGANTATPTVTDNGNGTYAASYTPSTTGADNIAITLNGTAIGGSPFASAIGAGVVDPAQSTATVPATGTSGVATIIMVTARDAAGNALSTGGSAVVINITGANTVTPTVTDNGDGTYSASYSPTAIGADNVAITLDGTAINGSPFTSTVATGAVDPTQSTAVVPANGEASVITNIVVTARDVNGNQQPSGGEAVVITITGANTATPAITDNGDGTYSASYTPNATGVDNIAITLNGTAINSSPFTSTVSAGGADPAQTTASVPANTTAGTIANITVTARDAAGNVLTAGGENVVMNVTGANPNSLTVTDVGNGTYTTSYTPTVAGGDTVTITLNGTAIGGSPYASVIAAAALDVSQSTITKPDTVPAGTDTTVTVVARDAFGNQLSTGGSAVVVFVTGVNLGNFNATDVGNGTYTITYSPTAVGSDDLAATIDGAAIGGGPYTTIVVAGAANALQTTAVVPAAGAVAFATNITVTARDANGNPRTTGGDTVVVNVTGANTATPTVTDNGNGTYSTSYTPAAAGTDNIAITLNGAAITGSPFTSEIGAGAADPAQSTATVPAGTVGAATAIVVQAVDGTGTPLATGGEIVVVTVTGANTATPTVTDVGNGTYTASYTPTSVGTDNVAITMNGAPISGSPYSSIVATGGASAANSYAIIPHGTIGTPTDILVQARDAGNNNVTAGGAAVVVTVTGANPGVPVVTDNADGTYSASYTPTANGADDIAITLGGTGISGSSYASNVSAVTALTTKISFESDTDTGVFNSDVFIVNEDGTGMENLTNNPNFSDERPAISPDGTKIAFTSTRDGDYDIYVMNSNGSGVVQLTNVAGRDRLPVWSPDGTEILFLSERNGSSSIFVMNPDGTGQTDLSNNFVDDFQADWSPDGSQIVFYNGFDVWTMDADGSNRTNITNSSLAIDIETSWGPGGIAFVSDRDGVASGALEVYTIQPDGTGLTRLTNDLSFDNMPEWSADGTRIVFLTDRDGGSFGGEIYIMNADGTNPVRITVDTGAEWAPKFIP